MTRTAMAPKFQGEGRITFEERTYPDPGDGQLLLRVRANAICGTDREQYYKGSQVVPGHEAAGTVEAVGAGVKTPVGTNGVVFLMDYCGKCRSCRLGFTNQCLAKRADMGFTHDGGYGPFELVHETNFFPIPNDIPLVEATLLLDVMGTSGHAFRRASLLRKDVESVYIAGAGPIGLGLLVMAKLRLGSDLPVYVGDISEWRLKYAAELGGIPVDSTKPGALSGLDPVDIAFDSTGKEVARRGAVDLLGKRGVLICVGHGESVTLDVSKDLIAPERGVLGSEYFAYSELEDNLKLLTANRDRFRQVITHTYPVEQIAEGFHAFLRGETGKVVVTQDPR